MKTGVEMSWNRDASRTDTASNVGRPGGLAVVLAVALIMSVYWMARYNGYAMEVDTTRMTIAADGILKTGSLIHSKAYPAGYTYPSLVAMTAQLTGARVPSLQMNASIMILVVALIAYVCYRELLDNHAVAVLGTLLLLVQPDFSFYILRSSHEKATWSLTLLGWFLLARIHGSMDRRARRWVYLVLFSVLFWGLVTTNIYFAATVLFGLGAYLLGGGWSYWRGRSQVSLREEEQFLWFLVMAFVIGSGLVLTSMYLVYPPAQDIYLVWKSLGTHLKDLLNGTGLQQPYAYVTATWISPGVYALLTAPQWAIVLVSLAGWWLGKKAWLQAGFKRGLLGWMYLAFGVLVGAGVLVDFSGFLSRNLQVRWFPALALVSSPIAAELLVRWTRPWKVHNRSVVVVAGSALMSYALAAGMLKVTNEPTLSNQWVVYTPMEVAAMRWTETHLRGQQVWTDAAGHPVEVLKFWEGYGRTRQNDFDYGEISAPPRNILTSRLRSMQAHRYGLAIPGTLGYNRVYDNGEVAVWRRGVKSIYQR